MDDQYSTPPQSFQKLAYVMSNQFGYTVSISDTGSVLAVHDELGVTNLESIRDFEVYAGGFLAGQAYQVLDGPESD